MIMNEYVCLKPCYLPLYWGNTNSYTVFSFGFQVNNGIRSVNWVRHKPIDRIRSDMQREFILNCQLCLEHVIVS